MHFTDEIPRTLLPQDVRYTIAFGEGGPKVEDQHATDKEAGVFAANLNRLPLLILPGGETIGQSKAMGEQAVTLGYHTSKFHLLQNWLAHQQQVADVERSATGIAVQSEPWQRSWDSLDPMKWRPLRLTATASMSAISGKRMARQSAARLRPQVRMQKRRSTNGSMRTCPTGADRSPLMVFAHYYVSTFVALETVPDAAQMSRSKRHCHGVTG